MTNPENPPTNPLAEAKAEALVERYVEIRDKRDALKQEHDDAIRPYEEAIARIAIELERRMLEQEVTAIKTAAGSVSRVITQTIMCEDWTAFDKWVIENNRPDVFPRKLNSGPFKDMLELGQPLPPGVRMEQAARVQVRRAAGTKKTA